MRWKDIICEDAAPLILYHITDNAKFKLNADFAPEDNSISISPRDGIKGIYLTKDVEKWVNGHGYIRPFVAEISVDPSALEHDTAGRWGGEIFIPASQFDKLHVNRVIPLDAHCREHFGLHGWLEGSLGREFDSGKPIDRNDWNSPFRGWQYPHDARSMSREELQHYKREFAAGHKARTESRD